MKFIEVKDNKVKLFGHTVYKVGVKSNRVVARVLGIPVYMYKDKYGAIRKQFDKTDVFNVTQIDEQISQLVSGYKVAQCDCPNAKRVGFIATEIYDMGGHTKWMRDMQYTLCDEYDEKLFLVNGDASESLGKQAVWDINKVSDIEIFNTEFCNYKRAVLDIYNSIISYSPGALFVFIHPNDIVGAAVLALIKQHTQIKLFFVNHATHRPNMAMSYCDLILEETNSTAYITQKLRKLNQTRIVGLISKRETDNPHYEPAATEKQKREWGIPDGAVCTMSGAAGYKFFDKDKSDYFVMIRQMLEQNSNVYHVVISNFNNSENAIIDKVFENSNVKDRLILLPFQDDYEFAFSCADLFIDNFPMSSALTFIDLMRLRVPYVVKINQENSALTFHEYQSSDFPYMYATPDEMLTGIETLLHNADKRKAMTDMNYQFYLAKYEPRAAFKILAEIIKCDKPESLYHALDESKEYQFDKTIFK